MVHISKINRLILKCNVIHGQETNYLQVLIEKSFATLPVHLLMDVGLLLYGLNHFK